jgi:hypothetical protein
LCVFVVVVLPPMKGQSKRFQMITLLPLAPFPPTNSLRPVWLGQEEKKKKMMKMVMMLEPFCRKLQKGGKLWHAL